MIEVIGCGTPEAGKDCGVAWVVFIRVTVLGFFGWHTGSSFHDGTIGSGESAGSVEN